MTQKQQPSAEDLASITERARQLIQQADFAGAEKLLLETLGHGPAIPDQADARYTLAVAQRYHGKPKEGLATLEQLIDIKPDYGRAWQERGHTELVLGKPDKALLSFQKAVRFNDALPASWARLASIYQQMGDHQRYQAANSELARLKSLPRELVSVSSMINEGRYYRAERLCRHFLQQHPHHIEAMRLLAVIGSELGVLTDAEFLLESCLEFAPNNLNARYDYANLLLKMQKFEGAYEQTEQLVESNPGNLAFLSLKANAAAGLGRQKEALKLYKKVLKHSPGQVALMVMRGHAEKTIGKFDDAIASYRAAYQLKPDHGDAFWSLANTKTYRFTDAEMRHMKKYEAAENISTDDRIHLCFALGKALEDREQFEDSFTYYDRGNALKKETVAHRSTHLNIRTSAQIDVCNEALFSQKKGVGHPAPDPIFIVGLPRAGSTLLEQILASHPQVEGTYELPHIIALAHRLRRSYQQEQEPGAEPRYPQILPELDNDYFRRFGKQIIEQTRVYRQNTPFFIDKNPNNFFHIGLIRLILPNAKVIDARRHPMSCCFSGFKQLFGQGQEFSYGLETIGNYYREYVQLMDHWDSVLPGYVLRVQYEDVVSDLEQQVRRLLDFCGLEFDPACLEFHKTVRSVRTPSSEQVRQPIYRSAMEQWRHFEPWLQPLKDALGDEVRARYAIE